MSSLESSNLEVKGGRFWRDSNLLLGGAILAFAAAFPPFTDAAAVNPSIHMVEHVLIVFSGALVAFSLVKRGALPQLRGRLASGAGLVGVASILVYWHLPGPWDAAIFNPAVHLAEHVSLFGAGVLISVCLLGVSSVNKVLLLVLAIFAHTAYAVILTSGVSVYPVYTIAQQGSFGVFVFAMDPMFLGLIMLVIWRGDFPVSASNANLERIPRLTRAVSVATTFVLVLMLLGFYTASAVAVSVSSPPAGANVVVIIQETPLSWQYSPQNVTVVLGINSTVTWLSHSLSYDTVTSDQGVFGSGQISPGGSFAFTFTKPGVYEYHCIYHPWMVGSVTVLPAD